MPAFNVQLTQEQLERAARYLPYLTAIFGISLALAGYFMLIKPALGDLLSGGAADTSPAVARLTEAESYRDRLESLAGSLAKMPPADLARIRSLVPDSADSLPVIMDFEAIAAQSGFALANVTTAVDARDAAVANRKTIRVSVDISAGDYRAVKRFLSLVERNPRIYDVRTLNLARDKKDYTIEMTTYYLDAASSPVKPVK